MSLNQLTSLVKFLFLLNKWVNCIYKTVTREKPQTEAHIQQKHFSSSISNVTCQKTFLQNSLHFGNSILLKKKESFLALFLTHVGGRPEVAKKWSTGWILAVRRTSSARRIRTDVPASRAAVIWLAWAFPDKQNQHDALRRAQRQTRLSIRWSWLLSCSTVGLFIDFLKLGIKLKFFHWRCFFRPQKHAKLVNKTKLIFTAKISSNLISKIKLQHSKICQVFTFRTYECFYSSVILSVIARQVDYRARSSFARSLSTPQSGRASWPRVQRVTIAPLSAQKIAK